MRSQNKYSQILFNLFALHQCWVTKYPELLAGRQGGTQMESEMQKCIEVYLGELALPLNQLASLPTLPTTQSVILGCTCIRT